MNKIELDKLDRTIYCDVMDNGLSVYVVPFDNVNNIYATFSTKYGSNDIEFVPSQLTKMKKFPNGVAHFLEHKMFENSSNVDPFTFYSERGADANANTSNFKTTYLFSGASSMEDNLNYLLDYVQDPYFTDENVLKERGIIEQEIKMYQDNPYTRIYETSTYNCFVKHPMKIPVIGTIQSINSITANDLYECYNTFYNPSNMFLVITGNVSYEEVFSIVRENQGKKKFKTIDSINIKKYREPNNVDKEFECINMPINIPKVNVTYKINIKKFKFSLRELSSIISIMIEVNFGATSKYNENIKNEKILNSDITYDIMYVGDHVIIMFLGETVKCDEFVSFIDKCVGDLSLSMEEVLRKKKCIISSLVYMSDNIYSVNNKIMNNVIKYNQVFGDDYSFIRNIKYEDIEYVTNNLDFSNKTVLYIKNNK